MIHYVDCPQCRGTGQIVHHAQDPQNRTVTTCGWCAGCGWCSPAAAAEYRAQRANARA